MFSSRTASHPDSASVLASSTARSASNQAKVGPRGSGARTWTMPTAAAVGIMMTRGCPTPRRIMVHAIKVCSSNPPRLHHYRLKVRQKLWSTTPVSGPTNVGTTRMGTASRRLAMNAACTVAVCGHADEIGLMVNHITDDGFVLRSNRWD